MVGGGGLIYKSEKDRVEAERGGGGRGGERTREGGRR